MGIRKRIDEAGGKICEVLIPIKKEYYIGRGDATAICTLSSIGLLEKISRSDEIMNRIAIAGRLLSENKGIDAMISFALAHPKLQKIILCGQEVKGHRAGQALLSLSRNGIDKGGRIIGALGPYAILRSPQSSVGTFRRQVIILDMVGTTEVASIARLVT
ncbi:MAG TPA: hypothetical protein VLA68_05860 [Nitrososphaera sp.]|nr:hypothetical protein [Nitrososphaera sp.]